MDFHTSLLELQKHSDRSLCKRIPLHPYVPLLQDNALDKALSHSLGEVYDL